jgi:hypothetical protein
MERRLRYFSFVCCFFTILVPAVFGQIGKIVYFDGHVQINRNGEIFDEYTLEVGGTIENYDTITTGADGSMSIQLTSPRCPQAELRVKSGTSFYIEINKVKDKEKTTIGMITGSIANNIKKLSGQQEYEIATSSVTMGVRGTTFEVSTSPGGDILATCNEGKVICYDAESGSEASLQPGKVIEKQVDAAFKSIPVAVSGLEKFRQDWLAERIEAFKANALRVTRQFAQKYLDLLDQFRNEYVTLMYKKEIINKWYQEDAEGRIGNKIQLLKEKKALIKELLKIRKTLFIFERVYFRLIELKAYHEQGIGQGQIKTGMDSNKFFKLFTEQQKELAQKMGKVKFVMSLYAKRNDGEFPLSLFGQDEEEDKGL